MYLLFIRILSDGLQAFLPVAVCSAWLRRSGRSDAAAAIRAGAVAAVPITVVAGYLFQINSHQIEWKTALASAATVLAAWFGAIVWCRVPPLEQPGTAARRTAVLRVALAAATVLIIVRETMGIVAVLMTAALDLRRFDVTLVIVGGAMLALAIGGAWTWVAGRFPLRALASATGTFTALFLAQAAMAAFHLAAEARMLPLSDVLHLATEPYGPEGPYGQYFSFVLIALPTAAAALSLVRSRASEALNK